MFAQHAMFAMHRDQNLRLHQRVHLLQIRAVRMARDVIIAHAVIDHIDAHLTEIVDNCADGLLVSGYRFGREQE